MKETVYRLGEYKIIETATGQLMWQAHFGFGEFQKGRCFRKGSVLFIGPAESHQNGFLKGEFLDALKTYAKWDKTKFYCIGAGVHHSKDGKRVTKEEMMSWTLGRGLGKGDEIHRDPRKNLSESDGNSAGKVAENVVFRLQRYEILIRDDGQITWRTYSGSNSVNSGNCFILENILFVGPQRNTPSNLNKRQFIAILRQLTRWNQTDFFCKRFSLHECNAGSRRRDKHKKLTHSGNDNICNYKKNSEANIPDQAYGASFSNRISANLDSFDDLLKSRDKYGRFINFTCIKFFFPKSIAIFREFGIEAMNKIRGIVAIISNNIKYLKKHHGRCNDKNRNEDSLDHRKDR